MYLIKAVLNAYQFRLFNYRQTSAESAGVIGLNSVLEGLGPQAWLHPRCFVQYGQQRGWALSPYPPLLILINCRSWNVDRLVQPLEKGINLNPCSSYRRRSTLSPDMSAIISSKEMDLISGLRSSPDRHGAPALIYLFYSAPGGFPAFPQPIDFNYHLEIPCAHLVQR